MEHAKALDVPIAWLWAEKVAEDIIRAGGGPVWPGSFEFRAARDVLALTLFLTEPDRSFGPTAVNQLERLRDHLGTATAWSAWCRCRLDRLPAATADIRLARQAWRWLQQGRLLPGPQAERRTRGEEPCRTTGVAACIGVDNARHLVGGRQDQH
jgi:hypothetical protein